MRPVASAALVAVDWGTSHLRVWALGADNSVLGEHRSDDGMGSTPRERFAPVLESCLAELGVPADTRAVMCGMVGSRQGWAEAGYISVPCALTAIAQNAVRVPGSGRDIRILPGLSKKDKTAPDVMRGEETQLLGLARLAAREGRRTVCMPGTHSKWVRMAGDHINDFTSYMTGEMFAALSQNTVLRHSVSDRPVDPASRHFAESVAASLDAPAEILSRLFSIRAAALLSDLSADDARARLSGFLIGQEIAGAKERFSQTGKVDLVGGGILGALYEAALRIAGFAFETYDSETLVLSGLTAAASELQNMESAG